MVILLAQEQCSYCSDFLVFYTNSVTCEDVYEQQAGFKPMTSEFRTLTGVGYEDTLSFGHDATLSSDYRM